MPGSSEYGASLTTSYGSYVFWFRNSHNRDLFIKDPWAYAPRMGGHCTASVAYVEGASKVVTGESSVPICVGEKDDYEEKTMGQAWVLVSDKLYFFNCDATWIFSKPKITSIRVAKTNSSRSRRWRRPTGCRNSARRPTGPSTRRTTFWLMGEAKDHWAHGAGFGCTGAEQPHDSCLAAGTQGAWLVDPLMTVTCDSFYATFRGVHGSFEAEASRRG